MEQKQRHTCYEHAASNAWRCYRTGQDRTGQEKEERAFVSPLESSVFFEEFWLAYPKKTAKGFARKAYDRALGRITHPEIMAGLAKYKFPSQTKFAPKPENWLDGDCWMDQKDGYFSETDSERQQWALRINGWKEKKFWLAKWGDPPGSPNCQCPKDLLAA